MFQAYSESGILQFDANFPMFRLSKIIKWNEVGNNYTATDNHLVAVWSTEQVISGISCVRKMGNNLFRIDAQTIYNRVYGAFLIFEPYTSIQPSSSLAGLELYNEQGQVVYSTADVLMKVDSTLMVPETTGYTLYGTGAGTTTYTWDANTGISATDKNNYAIVLAQTRIGGEYDYDGDDELDVIAEFPVFEIRNGQLWLQLRGEEVSHEYGWAGWAGTTYYTYGNQIAYIIDVTSIRDRLGTA